MLIIAFAEASVVEAASHGVVALTLATHTVSATLTLSAIVLLAGRSQALLVLIPNSAVTELTDVTLVAPK